MKTFATYVLCLLIAVLPGCQLPAGFATQAGTVVRDTVAVVDRNDDGVISNRELKDSKNDPMAWLTLVLGALGVLGGSAGVAARGLARKVETETDEQWEELKRLQTKS